jgi:hypothetical protein
MYINYSKLIIDTKLTYLFPKNVIWLCKILMKRLFYDVLLL